MSPRARVALFLAGAPGLAALLLWAYAGLPDFGHFGGRYGLILIDVGVQQRHATDVVTAVVFDYRGFDTLGEEMILFASAIAVALLLREARDRDIGRPRERQRSDAVRAFGLAAVGPALVTGLYVVAHGYITPGGGFQGGVMLAGALLLVYLAGEYRSFRTVAPMPLLDFAEGFGAGTYVVVGAVALLLGEAFLHNFLPLGTAGTLASSGTIALLNAAVGLEVAAAFAIVFTEFVEEKIQAERRGRRR